MTDKKSTFCSLPWIHLATHPHGGVTLCCVSDHSGAKNRARNYNPPHMQYLDINHDRLTNVMNSDYFKEVRLQLLNGEMPEACLRCYREENNNVRSKRIEENERLGFTEDMARAITSASGEIPVNFKFVELRLGNLCNVKCRTCNPASSTQWRQEYNQLQQTMKFVTNYDWKIDSSWTESDEFWDDLLEHSKDLQLLYVNGGEPTLVEKHWKYLEKLIDAGLNKQITLWYNINMTNLPDKLLELWKQFKEVQVTCSIDDLYHRNEYIRTGTNWDTVIANLDKIQEQSWIKPSICQTIGWMNIYYLPEFHNFMKARGLHVHMNFVYDPDFLSAAILPESVKEIILANLEEMEPWKINSVKTYLNSKKSDAKKLAQGMEYNQWLDNSRKTKYDDVFGEMAMVMQCQ